MAFAEIQNLVKRGNWYPAGACYENGDVNIPSPEALFRNILLGNRYFQEKFGVQSKDIFLPDCFGFGQALPSVMKYAGLLGFTTQKLSWGSAYGVPFTLGYWQPWAGVPQRPVLPLQIQRRPARRSVRH